MIDISQLLQDLDDSFDTGLEDSGKYQVTTQLLCSTARKYNNLYRELERLKETTGFDKPFPILRLPREIRDEIYTYSLRATIAVDVVPRIPYVMIAENPFKPPTPGLLRVNKQIHQEANEILYSKNIFRFMEPAHLFDFEDQIGLENCKRVSNMCIWIRFPKEDEVIPHPRYLARSEHDSVPSHWIAALKSCGLKQIGRLDIEAEMLFSASMSLLPMPENLRQCIKGFLGRVSHDKAPRLSLKGFREEEKEKFPKKWHVVIDQWDDYKKEVEGMRREMEEYDAYLAHKSSDT
ncbi:hypothetical protein EJ04DRAFT_508917 [Polyplosphaeria fusca]|uniref:Uncharacterized protein n=1 Tax=Polyplosphaeria fusca TaxID=682080 RepID=A0A9P4R4X8_9PLEO|nr:hypothetical protein EJ04DRAFT_508917 [Polyplosphaeria fusca]